MNELRTIILDLIDEKREDAFWDFKQEWHQNCVELLHDIVCLANAEHRGERFLIFGVTDPPECKIVGVQTDPNRKDQVKLLDFLSKVPFSGDLRPSVFVKTVHYSEGEVDVVLVHDVVQKPYTLSEKFERSSKYPSGDPKRVALLPGAVYSRIGDKNTALDRTADHYFVERMWRERFGLELSPLDRMQKYLFDYEAWKWDGIATGYYSTFPEFTISVGNEEKATGSHHWWSSWPMNEPSRRFSYLLKFHATTLLSIKVVQFDRESFAIPLPDIDYILIDPSKSKEATNTYCFYSFLESTISFSLLVHLFAPFEKGGPLVQRAKEKEALGSHTKPRLGFLPFPVFSSDDDKCIFLRYLDKRMLEFLQNNPTYPSRELGNSKQAEEKVFAYWAYDQFWKWKEQKTCRNSVI